MHPKRSKHIQSPFFLSLSFYSTPSCTLLSVLVRATLRFGRASMRELPHGVVSTPTKPPASPTRVLSSPLIWLSSCIVPRRCLIDVSYKTRGLLVRDKVINLNSTKQLGKKNSNSTLPRSGTYNVTRSDKNISLSILKFYSLRNKRECFFSAKKKTRRYNKTLLT